MFHSLEVVRILDTMPIPKFGVISLDELLGNNTNVSY